MKRILLLLAFLFSGSQLFAQAPATETQKLNVIFDRYQEYLLKTFPEWASYTGDRRYDDKLTNLSDTASRARYDSLRMFVALTKTIKDSLLGQSQYLNYTLFLAELQNNLESENFRAHLMPITHQSGIHIEFPQITEYQPLKTAIDYQKYFTRLRGFERQVNDVITNMRIGMRDTIMPPKFTMVAALAQIDKFRKMPTDSMPFMAPLKAVSTTLPETQKEVLRVQLRTIINKNIKPSYEKLYAFIKNEYLPQCREQDGIWSLADGTERYKSAIRFYTTTKMSPERVFSLGLQEVDRLRKEMEAVKNEIGFKDSLHLFNKKLRTDSTLYFKNNGEFTTAYANVLLKMSNNLREFFGRVPESTYNLDELESYRNANVSYLNYFSAGNNNSGYEPTKFPKFSLTAVALHETVPGQHLQSSIERELKNMPKFRRAMDVKAFVEGWGLYAESLGYEAGMYDDLYQKYGALAFEMQRACRMVVDAGIHSKKWTREQAVQFMLENTPAKEADIRAEVDRYAVQPGQALAYKVGELKIKELRKSAQMLMGGSFSLRSFHEIVLENGAIPLTMLEKNVDQWINENR
jgi:prolyl oligopeptidase